MKKINIDNPENDTEKFIVQCSNDIYHVINANISLNECKLSNEEIISANRILSIAFCGNTLFEIATRSLNKEDRKEFIKDSKELLNHYFNLIDAYIDAYEDGE